MTKISQLTTDAAPTLTDYVPTVDTETSTTKRVLLSSVRTLLLPAPVVDANGWKIYDFGTFKQYKKRGVVSMTLPASTWNFTATITPFPVGMGQFGTNFVEASVSFDDPAPSSNLVNSASNTTIVVRYYNPYTSSVTASLYWSISITTP